MSEQSVDLSDPGVLQRTAEPLVSHYAGVFFPEVVEGCVARAHAELSRDARIQTYLVPMAMRLAREHLQDLAAARTADHSAGNSAGTPPGTGPSAGPGRLHQVLFVDEDDTTCSQIAAALLAHHTGSAVVARSGGVTAGGAVDPLVPAMLAEREVEVGHLYPKPVTEDVVAAADRVITFGAREGIRVHPGTVHDHWAVEGLFSGTGPGRAREIVEAIDARVQDLVQQLRTETVVGSTNTS
jgi:arsenate reductase